MLNRYKIEVSKVWEFELNGSSKEDVEEQVVYIINKTKILDKPETNKKMIVKIKKTERNIKNE